MMAFLFKLHAFVGILIISRYSCFHAEKMQGRVIVIDGDTLEMHGTRLRLHGVDTPESKQFVFDNADETFRCGQTAAMLMKSFVSDNIDNCTRKEKDRYRRLVEECFVDWKNINKQLVRDRFALAYGKFSNDYTEEEKYASKIKSGVWQGQFI